MTRNPSDGAATRAVGIAIAFAGVLLAGICVGRFLAPSALRHEDERTKSDARMAGESAGSKPQATCPITGKPIDRRYYVEDRGQRIYVADRDCLSAVRQDPEAALRKLAEKREYAESQQTVCPVSGGPINRAFYVEYQGRRIYTCCPACRDNRVKPDPAKYAELVADDIAQAQAAAATPKPSQPHTN